MNKSFFLYLLSQLHSTSNLNTTISAGSYSSYCYPPYYYPSYAYAGY